MASVMPPITDLTDSDPERAPTKPTKPKGKAKTKASPKASHKAKAKAKAKSKTEKQGLKAEPEGTAEDEVEETPVLYLIHFIVTWQFIDLFDVYDLHRGFLVFRCLLL